MSAETLPHVTGKWRNASIVERGGTLWEYLTKRGESAPDAIVTLEMSGPQTLTASLLTNGAETDSQTISITQKKQWLKLPLQHLAHPLLWYIVWGWETRDVALGVSDDGNLCVNCVGDGCLMITVVPTIGDGGWPGIIGVYKREE